MTTDASTPQNDAPDDDWDLDDDELTLDDTVTDTVKPEPRGFSPRPASQETAITRGNSVKAPETPTGPPENLASPTQVPSEDDPAPSPARSRTPSSKPQKVSKPTSLVEKILLLAVIAILGGGLFWGIANFYSEAPEGELVEFTTDFPVAGDEITIESVGTWWREPVRTGDDTDIGVVIEAQLIPCARIQITGNGSTALQVSFRDGENNLIGDTINLIVKNGTFSKSDSNEVIVNGTAGFSNSADINPYSNQDIEPWSLVIVEGDKTDDPLVKARVLAKREKN